MSEEDMSDKKRKLDYSEGKNFIARNAPNDGTDSGSTCQTPQKRMTQHKIDMRRERCHNCKLQKEMSEIGKDAFYIELIEEYPCRKRDELLKREGEKIKEHQRELDRIISGRSKKEYRQDNSQ